MPTTPLAPVPSITADRAGVEQLVRWAAQTPLRDRWPAPRIRADYCNRSPAEILADGTIPWTAPCADLASLVALGLERAGLRPTLILTGIRRPLQPVKFQTGLELELDGRTHVIGYAVAATYFYPGTFIETRRRPWVLRKPVDGPLDPERSFLSWFDLPDRAALSSLFPGYVLEKDLRAHVRQGTSWIRYALARRKSSRHPRGPDRLVGANGRWA